jgi:hypothetical protein
MNRQHGVDVFGAHGTARRSVSRAVISSILGMAVVASALVGATPASADSIQYQSYQRGSQSEACAAQSGETAWQASWGSDASWKPTWEQWANGGKGGWTCTRSITWARTPVAGGSPSVTYQLGDIGPGGGLVFLISGGLTYEMAPNTWSGAGTPDEIASYCDSQSTDVSAANGTAVGTGSANTAAMAASGSCSSDAAAAVLAYGGTDSSTGQWFLPSQDELNAMCNYSRNPSAPAAPSVSCYESGGTVQDGDFASDTYGFISDPYWSSSQMDRAQAWAQHFNDGNKYFDVKNEPLRGRPIRAF